MKILGIYSEWSGCDYHRVRLPLETMQLEDGDAIIIKEVSDLQPVDLQADIIYYNRIPPISKGVLKSLQKQGTKIVCDIDDYWELPEKHYMYKDFKGRDTAKVWISNMKNADLVTCTNPLLREQILKYNRNCEVIPNALPYGYGQFIVNRIELPSPVIIYVAGPSHLEDLKLLRDACIELYQDDLFKGVFHLAGYTKGEPIWESMLAQFGRNEIMTSPYSQIDRYMQLYNFSDISIAPVTTDYFNRFKSNLKILEAGCAGIPIVCSNLHPYIADSLAPGVYFADSDHDWHRNLRRLSVEKNLREEKGKMLQEYCIENYNLIKINKLRKDLLKRLLRQ